MWLSCKNCVWFSTQEFMCDGRIGMLIVINALHELSLNLQVVERKKGNICSSFSAVDVKQECV